MCPSEIHKHLPEAASRVLDIQLKELVDDGLIDKTIYPELPPKSEYRISGLGKTLLPIIDAMIMWGENHMKIFEHKYLAVKFSNFNFLHRTDTEDRERTSENQ